MHFIAHYEGEIICGKLLGEPDTGWNSLPDKPIHKLEYINPYGETVVLEGYAEYNHFIEIIQRMGEKPYITRIFLMGASNGEDTPLTPLDRGKTTVKVYEIILDGAHLGQVITKEYVRGMEYDGGPSWGWKRGAMSNEC